MVDKNINRLKPVEQLLSGDDFMEYSSKCMNIENFIATYKILL